MTRPDKKAASAFKGERYEKRHSDIMLLYDDT